ncbi:MAG: methylamine utilization protein MauD [Thermaurantiacus tibetensis]|uniref:methylamine utilization protein MauD n=1 Tax=Thermaurantiacus tibetensis TaxID=2759035 RepID=UPI00188EB415|nr:methylamine utilization protein MauD [Thermaurantiacus tibetensis]
MIEVVVILLVLAVGVLGVAVVALARQVGVLHERIAPVGALVADTGAAPGAVAPAITAPTLANGVRTIGPGQIASRGLLLLFVGSGCPICKRVVPLAQVLARAERLELLLVADPSDTGLELFVSRFRLPPERILLSEEAGRTYGVAQLPTAALLDTDGRLIARGLVNSREHLESLLEARRLGHPTLGTYLAERPATPVQA